MVTNLSLPLSSLEKFRDKKMTRMQRLAIEYVYDAPVHGIEMLEKAKACIDYELNRMASGGKAYDEVRRFIEIDGKRSEL